jgi:hypothetical protein
MRKSRIRNTTIVESLNTGLVVVDIEKRNLKWCGDLIKMNNKRKTKQIYEAQP